MRYKLSWSSMVAKGMTQRDIKSAEGLFEYGAFRDWLLSDAKIGRRSAIDVISRLRRANSFFDLSTCDAVDEAVEQLEQTPEYKELSRFVGPQLRRAVRFYIAFEQGMPAPK